MRAEFIAAIIEHQPVFGSEISVDAIERLADYYEIVEEHNALLHLVAPCSPREFATRHILESLAMLEFLPTNAKFADVGTGAGLPSIPCLLVREDLRAILIESKEKKASFLDLTIQKLGLAGRVRVVAKQFQEVDPADCQVVTCRALDKFVEKLPRLLKWSMRRKLLLFGGENLKIALQENHVEFAQKLMPLSEQRYLFISATV